MKRRLFQVDAFTRESFLGNPAGVIWPADGLTDEQMQRIARELNNSESAFLFEKDGPDHDLRVRFFTPMTEIAMCGHNTVALHAVRAWELGHRSGHFVQKTAAGLIPVDVAERDGHLRISMTQTVRGFEDRPLEAAEVLAALGAREADRDPAAPVQIASTGNRKLILPLREPAAVHALSPDFVRLAAIGRRLDCTGFYVFAFDGSTPATSGRLVTHGRMFGPQIGIPEDPVTGMAIGPLGGYLVRNRLVAPAGDRFEFVARQGEAMGRAGWAEVSVRCQDGEPTTVDVAGEAALVFSTTIEI